MQRRSSKKSNSRPRANSSPSRRKIRYAVCGLGYFAQTAVLPAFAHAGENSELVALVSGDNKKLKQLGRKYGVDQLFSYGDFGQCVESGDVDAVYIVTTNNRHHPFAIAAANAGVHVLTEKPMATREEDCRAMIEAASSGGVKLMVGYRLHFEQANLKAAEIVRSGKIGDPRYFTSTFSMQVKEGNSRLRADDGGGVLWDIGIYCIQAARMMFRDEPLEVFAWRASNGERRFAETEEMLSAVMKYPGDRLAQFTASFGAADTSAYQVIGVKGDLCVDPAYEFAEGLAHRLTIDGRTTQQEFPKRDQIAPEIVYFSDCILNKRDPEPSGQEGLADVRIIRALYSSAHMNRPVELAEFAPEPQPSLRQQMRKPPLPKQPPLIHAQRPH